ncbi:MAG TPA: PAS domain-containing protein [Actinomycetota bacterium]|nr:PAS domain-containing protein [Actinomycetota bacterium]
MSADLPHERPHDEAPWGSGLSEALYRSLVEQIPAVVYVDTNERSARSLYVAPQARELFGIDPGRLVADATTWIDAVHPDDREIVHGAWLHAVETGTRCDIEYRWNRPDDETIWVRDISVAVDDERGEARLRQGVMFDVTEAKRTEEELRASEARYRLLVEQIPAVIYQVAPDDDRRTLWVSPSVEDALGYSRQEWLGQPDIWVELLHPDDREPILAAHDDHNATGAPWSREYRLIASDGRPVWFRDVARLLRDEDGRPTSWLGVQLEITEQKRLETELRTSRDDLERRVHERTSALEEANALMSLEIAERRRVERELRATEQRFRLLAEQIPAVTYVWAVTPEPDDAYYTSPRIEELLGYTVDEWHQRFDFWMSRIHPDDRTRVIAATLRSEATGQPFSQEYRFLHKDGHIVWVLDQATLFQRDADGRPALLQGVMVDITPRKEAERLRDHAQTAYRTLIEQIPAVTYVEVPGEDPTESHLAYVSPQAERIFGVPTEVLTSDPRHFSRMIHPDDRARVISANARSNQTGEPFDEEFRVVRHDGDVVWLHSRASLVRGADGEPSFWHGVALDVTAQRDVEASLRELEERYRTLSGRVARVAGEDAAGR